MCEKTNYKTSNPRIDKCMIPLIKWFEKDDVYTLHASCCGHGKYPMTIVISWFTLQGQEFYELLSNTKIPRKRNFYKRDKQGYYYIPEVGDIK